MEPNSRTDRVSGALRCVVFFLLSCLLIGWLESYEILNIKSVAVETVVFIFVMIIGDISNNVSDDQTYELDCTGWARVALFIMLSVLPAFWNYLVNNYESSDIFSCIFRVYKNESGYDVGKVIVVTLALVGVGCAYGTAHKLRQIKSGQQLGQGVGDGGFPGFSALMSSLVAVVMLSVYLVMSHLNGNTVNCSKSLNAPEALVACLFIVILYVSAVMTFTRHFSVYILIPGIDKVSNTAPNSIVSAYNQLLLLIVFILVLVFSFHYWDSLTVNPILLILFGLFVCIVSLKLLSALMHWRRHCSKILLLLITVIFALTVTYLAMVYLHKRSNYNLKEIPLSPETIEYLDQFKTN